MVVGIVVCVLSILMPAQQPSKGAVTASDLTDSTTSKASPAPVNATPSSPPAATSESPEPPPQNQEEQPVSSTPSAEKSESQKATRVQKPGGTSSSKQVGRKVPVFWIILPEK